MIEFARVTAVCASAYFTFLLMCYFIAAVTG